MSGPQRQCSGEPTCRLPNDNLLGSRQVCSRTPDSRPVGSPTTICWGADTSAPQRQLVDLSVPQRRYAVEPTCLLPNARQPTCRLPNDNLLWSRHVCSPTPDSRHVCSRTPASRPVGAPTPICWGADMSGLQRRCSIGCSGSGYCHRS